MQKDLLEQLKEEMPAIVFRHQISHYGFSPRTMANLDSKGQGPVERIRIGRKIAYGRDSLIEWMRGKVERTDLHGKVGNQ